MKKSDFIHIYKSIVNKINLSGRNVKILLASLSILIIAVLLISLSMNNKGENANDTDIAVDLPVNTPTPAPESVATDEIPIGIAELQVIDLSTHRIALESSMLRINEPTPWGKEILFSAGNAATIDEPVLLDLYIYNLNTGVETKAASTSVKFGEIYEGRLNENYIVWLDTDQRGTNIIYSMNRKTGEVTQVKKSNYTHPQLRLFGDNLVWVEQIELNEDRLYLYNFKSGEPITLESFTSSSYGTSPPSIYNDIVVWAYPHPEDANRSIIKKLDLKEALSLPTQDSGNSSDNNSNNNTDNTDGNADNIDIIILPEDGQPQVDEEAANEEDYGIKPLEIDPVGFAIYPATNGSAVAWLDNLNPSLASLKLTLDDGKNVIDVAKNVGRIFGIGDTFIAYMQNDSIMIYFWEAKRYARLTAEGEAGRLSDICVAGNGVVWYDANDPSQTKDSIMVSFIDPSLIKD